jgi:hypothetical protein
MGTYTHSIAPVAVPNPTQYPIPLETLLSSRINPVHAEVTLHGRRIEEPCRDSDVTYNPWDRGRHSMARSGQ